jgi:hypothetical protein
MSPKRESNERTKQNGILKGDQKLWSLHFTDSVWKVKKQTAYPKGGSY